MKLFWMTLPALLVLGACGDKDDDTAHDDDHADHDHDADADEDEQRDPPVGHLHHTVQCCQWALSTQCH